MSETWVGLFKWFIFPYSDDNWTQAEHLHCFHDIWHPDYPNCELTEWKIRVDQIYFFVKLDILQVETRTFGACVIQINACWQEMIFFLVNCNVHFADWPKKQAIFCCRIANWPKVTNIFMNTFSLLKCTYNFLLPGTWWKKFPIFYKVLKTWPQ